MSETASAGGMNQHLMRLAALQMLQRRVREVEPGSLGFVMVNETMQVLAYQQAALWDIRHGITAVSGAERPEQGAPYVRWLSDAAARFSRQPGGLRAVGPDDVGEWDEWMPRGGLWCPFVAPDGRVVGGLVLARPEPWGEGDREVAGALCGAYAQSFLLAAMKPRRGWATPRATRHRAATVAAVALLAALGAMPVRESVLAPAEVVPERPALVRAPFAGVVESIDVAPNAAVHTGQIVATMNRRQLETQAQVARKALEVAQAEYREATQQAMTDSKARASVAPLSSKIDQAQADLDYQSRLLERAAIPAPAEGLAVFGDPSEWIGKPVETGERIMLVAPPESRRLEIHVPVSAAVTFAIGADVLFFDDVHPDRPRRGHVDFASYGSAASPDGTSAYAFRALLDPAGQSDPGLRLGLKGTGKILGERRPLALWILRKPIMAVRQWLVF